MLVLWRIVGRVFGLLLPCGCHVSSIVNSSKNTCTVTYVEYIEGALVRNKKRFLIDG